MYKKREIVTVNYKNRVTLVTDFLNKYLDEKVVDKVTVEQLEKFISYLKNSKDHPMENLLLCPHDLELMKHVYDEVGLNFPKTFLKQCSQGKVYLTEGLAFNPVVMKIFKEYIAERALRFDPTEYVVNEVNGLKVSADKVFKYLKGKVDGYMIVPTIQDMWKYALKLMRQVKKFDGKIGKFHEFLNKRYPRNTGEARITLVLEMLNRIKLDIVDEVEDEDAKLVMKALLFPDNVKNAANIIVDYICGKNVDAFGSPGPMAKQCIENINILMNNHIVFQKGVSDNCVPKMDEQYGLFHLIYKGLKFIDSQADYPLGLMAKLNTDLNEVNEKVVNVISPKKLIITTWRTALPFINYDNMQINLIRECSSERDFLIKKYDKHDVLTNNALGQPGFLKKGKWVRCTELWYYTTTLTSYAVDLKIIDDVMKVLEDRGMLGGVMSRNDVNEYFDVGMEKKFKKRF